MLFGANFQVGAQLRSEIPVEVVSAKSQLPDDSLRILGLVMCTMTLLRCL